MPPVHDYIISNGTGAAVRSDLNNALAAIVSNNSSATEPATKYAYQWWADTNTGILKIRNSSNNGWVELLQLDGTLTLEDGSASQPALAFRDDLSTGIFSGSQNEFNITTASVERFVITASGHMGLGSTDPEVFGGGFKTLEVAGSTTDNGGVFKSCTSNNAGSGSGGKELIIFTDGNGGNISVSTAHPLIFKTSNAEQARIDASGRLLVGTTTSVSTLGLAANIQQFGGDASASSLALRRGDNSAQGAFFVMSKSRNATDGSRTIVQNGDELGNIFFVADDGTDLTSSGAAIKCHIDGAVGANDTPARLSFWTCTDGNSSATEKMRLTNNGELVIGSTTASCFNGAGAVHRGVVVGSTTNTNANSNHSAALTISNQDGTANNTSGIHFAREDNDGTPHFIGASVVAQFRETMNTGNYPRADLVFLTSSANNNAPSEKMRLDASGDLMIGTDDEEPGRGDTNVGVSFRPDGRMFLSAGGTFSSINRNSDGVVLAFARSGVDVGNISVAAAGNTAFNTTSDYRLKENAVIITDGIKRLKTLKPYKFNFKKEPEKIFDGFFAHEVTAVPNAVTGKKDEVDNNNNPVYQSMDYGKITPLLTAALQEAIGKIEVLETKVAKLEAA
tara:strand:+ start:2228 stop:4090 length:1863 start_codon:yes stop_codon:yes gene_type:complete